MFCVFFSFSLYSPTSKVMDKFLSSIYYDPKHPAAFSTVTKLYNASKRAKKPYTRKRVENWLLAQDTYTLYKPQRKQFPTRRTMAYGIDDVHQADLGDMSKHAEHNDGITFLLIVIDVISKFAFVQPLKNKSNESMVKAFQDIYGQQNSRVPKSLGTDQGTEFTGSRVQNILKKYKIHHYVLYNRQKAAVAERFLRTIKGKLHKYMDSQGSERYIDKLPEFVSAYNSTVHRSIKMAPNDVNMLNVAQVMSTLYPQLPKHDKPKSTKHNKSKLPKRNKPKFKVGDKVRISKYRQIFDKGYEQNYTDEVFTIYIVKQGIPPVYKLKDYDGEEIRGTFYHQELVKVLEPKNKAYRIDYVLEEKGRGKSKKYLVKYRGYSKPEWTASIPINISSKKK